MVERNLSLNQLNSEIFNFLENNSQFWLFVNVEFNPKKTGSGDLTHSGPCKDVASFIRNELKKLFISSINDLTDRVLKVRNTKEASATIVEEVKKVERTLNDLDHVNGFETSGGWIRERKVSFYINLILERLNTTIRIDFTVTARS